MKKWLRLPVHWRVCDDGAQPTAIKLHVRIITNNAGVSRIHHTRISMP